ncbi:MAG: SAVED domain-containing protein [Melioribacteraceae bacterium]|nr:SAVED domain-containing protein [Melioribacteraceae bacterium]MCF8392718.1 SAVED domain-containing protein [Melioribacteraceae bacterium]MCF8417740.1 SAVED domain-containing protein [Melioribacteraceae bacterium]
MVERVRKAIPQGIARKLWVKAAGRCEYCNEILWQDSLTKRDMNKAYISHIIAAKPKGPRGDKILSKKLEIDFENLMLLCDECHNRIDESDSRSHTVKILKKIKEEHERRIELLTEIKKDKRSYVVIYTANIGKHTIRVSDNEVFNTIIPDWYPAEGRSIKLGMNKSLFIDESPDYWKIEEKNLITRFNKYIAPLLEEEVVHNFSLFALAPQPLLIRLGTLFSDIPNISLYQKHKEPATWKWQESAEVDDFAFNAPTQITDVPGLKFALSANVNDERIHKVLGKNCSIWSITIPHPNNDFLKTKDLLSKFRKVCRKILNEIKTAHGENIPLHIFPAMPVSAAVEFGRVWMPKADLPLVIYDQNTAHDGFIKTIGIKNEVD